MNKRTRPVIIYPRGTTKRLAEHYGLSDRQIREILKFNVSTPLSAQIRKDCLENYGGAITEIPVVQ